MDGKKYALDVFCIMSNHVHVVFTPMQRSDGVYVALSSIMQTVKGYTARKANRYLQRKGAFWHHESYDHVVRDEGELGRIRRYVLQNPVKAGLAEAEEEWPHSWASWW